MMIHFISGTNMTLCLGRWSVTAIGGNSHRQLFIRDVSANLRVAVTFFALLKLNLKLKNRILDF